MHDGLERGDPARWHDAPGRRLAQLVYWTPALQLALGTYHLPGPALIAPALAAHLLARVKKSPAQGPGRADIIFQRPTFS
jgi:hypothetical protein